jgi:hypothetical protein
MVFATKSTSLTHSRYYAQVRNAMRLAFPENPFHDTATVERIARIVDALGISKQDEAVRRFEEYQSEYCALMDCRIAILISLPFTSTCNCKHLII